MSRYREYLEEQKIVSEEIKLKKRLKRKEKINYQQFKEILKNAPPAPVSVPDYEAGKKFMQERMFSKMFKG